MMRNDVFPNWLSTIPNFGKMPLYSTKLRMMLSIGSYGLIQPQSTDEAVVIRIVDYSGDNVFCNVFDLLTTSERPLNTTVKAYGIIELVQTCKKCTITINEIKDIVFLFTLNDVESGIVSHGGIRNCYLVRYRKNHLLELENVGYTYTFPCQSPLHIHFRTSTAAIIWNGVVTIQDILWKILNTESQNQLLNPPKVPANIDTVLWDYLLYRCSNTVKSRALKGVLGKIRGTTLYGLQRTSTRIEKNPYLLRFQTHEQLKVLRSIFGDFSTFGCRRRRPKLGRTETVQHNNKLNIVLGIDKEEMPFKNKTYNCCVDIGKDQFGAYVQVVYDSYLYTQAGIINHCDEDVSTDSYVIDMMTALRQQQSNDDEREMIEVGSMVRRDDGKELLKVTEVAKHQVTLQYILPATRSGEVVVEKDVPKIMQEINALFDD